MTKYKKGQSGNPKGRPKGSKNTKEAYVKEWIVTLIGSNAKELLDNFNRLPLKERFKVVTSLMPYVLPKQTETKIDGNVDLSTLSDIQLNQVIDVLISEIDNGTSDG